MGKRKYDWEKIRQEYVECDSESDRPTYAELADRYGVTVGYLMQKAAREEWTGQAKEYLRKAEGFRQQKLIEERAEQLVRIDSAKLDIAEALFSMLHDRLYQMQESDPRQFLKPYEINHYAQSLAVLSDLCDRARGDTFGAIQTLSDQGILSAEDCYQIAQAFARSDMETTEAIAKILRGQDEHPE